MAGVVRCMEDHSMVIHSDTHHHQPAWFSSTPPRRVLGSLVAYVFAVSVGIAAVVALATAEVPVNAWIAPF